MTSLGKTVRGLLKAHDTSIAELIAATRRSAREIETELFQVGDVLLVTLEGREAHRLRFGERYADWPRGVPTEILEAWHGVSWRWAGEWRQGSPCRARAWFAARANSGRRTKSRGAK